MMLSELDENTKLACMLKQTYTFPPYINIYVTYIQINVQVLHADISNIA